MLGHRQIMAKYADDDKERKRPHVSVSQMSQDLLQNDSFLDTYRGSLRSGHSGPRRQPDNDDVEWTLSIAITNSQLNRTNDISAVKRYYSCVSL